MKTVTVNEVLSFILDEIKKENEVNYRTSFISQDSDNDCLIDIFHDAMNYFPELNLNIIDDDDILIEIFGYEGYESIRDAEQGSY